MSVVLKTPSNGSVTLAEQDTASDVTVTIPATTGNAVISTPDLAYSPYVGFRNRIINGGMTIDQRNAGASVTITTTNPYMVDRWQAISTELSKYSFQQNAGSVTPPSGFSKYLGVTSLSAYSVGAADFFQVKQIIEGNNIADLAWGTANAQAVTLSFWVRSSLTGNFGFVLSWGSSSANQRAYPILYAISSANTWEYKTITIPGDTTMPAGGFETGAGGGFQLRFGLGGGATNAGASGSWATANYQTVTGATSVVGTNGATFYITGVQLEKGSTATPFEFRSYGTELGLCQRYYFRIRGSETSSNTGTYGNGFSQTTTAGRSAITFPVPMRTSPSALEQSGTASDYRVVVGSAGSIACSAVPTYTSSSILIGDISWTVASGGVQDTGVFFMSNSANSYLGWSAEL